FSRDWSSDVCSSDLLQGWVSADYITGGSGAPAPDPEPDPAPVEVASLVTTSALNLRSDASLSGAVLTVIPSGTTVSVTGDGQNEIGRASSRERATST